MKYLLLHVCTDCTIDETEVAVILLTEFDVIKFFLVVESF